MLVRVSRSRAIGGGVVGAGFALPRDAGRRPALHFRGGVLPSARKKQMAANSVRCLRDRGESVKGGNPPCHKSTMTNRNSPPRAAGAQGSFDSGAKRRAVAGWGPNSKQNYDRKLFQIKAPSGDRSTLIAGRRPPPGELAGAPCPRDSARVAMRGFAAVRLAGGGVVGAGFALPRDRGRGCWGGFRAPARCRSETGAPFPWWRTAECAKKTNGSELRSLPA